MVCIMPALINHSGAGKSQFSLEPFYPFAKRNQISEGWNVKNYSYLFLTNFLGCFFFHYFNSILTIFNFDPILDFGPFLGFRSILGFRSNFEFWTSFGVRSILGFRVIMGFRSIFGLWWLCSIFWILTGFTFFGSFFFHDFFSNFGLFLDFGPIFFFFFYGFTFFPDFLDLLIRDRWRKTKSKQKYDIFRLLLCNKIGTKYQKIVLTFLTSFSDCFSFHCFHEFSCWFLIANKGNSRYEF